MYNHVDSDGATNEAIVLTVLPAIVTLVMKIADDMKSFDGPYLNSILIMIGLNYAAHFFNTNSSWRNNAMLTRLGIDLCAGLGAIMIGDSNFPLNGPPEPKSYNDCLLTFVGVVSIVATVRGCIWILAIALNGINNQVSIKAGQDFSDSDSGRDKDYSGKNEVISEDSGLKKTHSVEPSILQRTQSKINHVFN